MRRFHPRSIKDRGQHGINMVDLMMWLVIAALLLAAAIQSIGYYQQAAYAYQATSDLSGGNTWVAAKTSLTSKIPTSTELQEALDNGDFSISNDNDLALIASAGQKYCVGIKAGNVNVKNVFYSTSDDPSRVLRDTQMPVSCGSVGEAGGPNAPAADSDSDGTPNTSDDDIDNDGIPNSSDPDMDNDGIANETDDDTDGDRTPNSTDDTPNGFSDDKDTDSDGTPDSADNDIDGDGSPNVSDNDIDGDGSLNPGDLTPFGDGSYSGPSGDHESTPYTNATYVDPRLELSTTTIDPDGPNVNFLLKRETDGAGMIGNIYTVHYRVTCQLVDGSQFFRHGYLTSSYKHGDVTSVNYTVGCQQTGGTAKAVGYVVGAQGSHPALITSDSYRGPKNFIVGGSFYRLSGHDSSTAPATGSNVDTRVLVRKVDIKTNSVDVGLALEVGAASSSGNIYGVQYRLTCELADGSQYYKHGNLTTSYKQDSYPAPVFNIPCPTGSNARGIVTGPDGGDPALNDPIGYKGPNTVTKRGIVSPLEGNVQTTRAADQTYSNSRVSVRNVTFDGINANLGINTNIGGAGGSGTLYSVTYRVTCKNTTTGAISYKSGSLTTSYSSSTHPAPTFAIACNTGTEAVGAVVGPYGAHPALNTGSSYRGPVDYAVVGQQQ